LFALALGKTRGLNDMSWAGLNMAALLNVLYLPYPNGDTLQIFQKQLTGVAFPLNGPAWSLFFALVANILYARLIRSGTAWAAAVVLVSAVTLVVAGLGLGEAPGWSTTNLGGGLPRVTFAFFVGVGLYQLRPVLDRLPSLPGWLVAGFALAMLSIPRFDGHIFYWLFCAVAIVPALVALAAGPARVEAPWAVRLCEYSGSLSYAIFCIHYPVLMLFAMGFADSVSVSMLVAYVATTLALSHVLHRYVERPVRRWLSFNPGMVKP
ncbi:MAG TPA: acyltransferase family protein, partial [Usitatibacter sp.]|nr:acyltransferase family protein [Usitatibacter sp.]